MTEELARRRRFDESKIKRNKGRFAKKVGKALLTGGVPASRLDKTAPAQVFARHEDGDVTHVSRDGKTRLQYDAATGRFNKQEIQDDGSWETTQSLSKLDAFLETALGWRVANDQDDGAGVRAIPADAADDEPNAPDAPEAPDTPVVPDAETTPSDTDTPEAAEAPEAPEPDETPPTSAPQDPGPQADAAFLPVDPAYPTRDPADMERITGGTPTRTPEQTQAVRDYSVRGYRDMNSCLRTGNGCTPEVQARNAELESAATTTTEPATTFRAMTLANLGGGVSADNLDSLLGSEISDAGFTSTSLDPAQTAIFGEEQDSVNVQIEIPAGSRVIYPGSDAAIQEEQEVILPPGTRYRVLESNTPPPPERPSIRIQVIP